MSIKMEAVTKKYGKDYALKNVSISFEKGRIYGLIGPNGSGKSTALKLITGLAFPDEGSVSFNNQTVSRKTSDSIAYLTELDMFYETFTVQETIDYVASQFTDFNHEKATLLLKEMKLDTTKKVKTLSKGNRGRLKLVTTLARDAEVILLDEPFSGLDPLVRDSIVKSLLRYLDFDHQILLIATHEINEIEPLLDEAIAIYYGDIIGQEKVEELREEQGLSVLEWFKQLVEKFEGENK
ncbi:ABC transporter ATP-binding protein [Aquibacillus rhizosphaerae]|uniref:ABC transporter ATP-binding protein n=1 Tax=Aquibacillus rhizosphaerae TaxID=3051431 RepID=A0ABT7L1P8_9BACI|nr:ABC transporter ATP-binding protein [Aquibacillus sp. LR5S19]MDL4839744.1 ABC transporter ATP-binding protein [Aquibacillus sp. LR5S19]